MFQKITVVSFNQMSNLSSFFVLPNPNILNVVGTYARIQYIKKDKIQLFPFPHNRPYFDSSLLEQPFTVDSV